MKINEGFKYEVYLEDDERVRKEPKNRKEVRYSCLRNDPLGTLFLEGGLKPYVDRLIESRRKSIQHVRKRDDLDHILGNPEIGEEGVIYQDRADTIDDIFKTGLEDYRQVIDDFVDLTKKCWRKGIGDASLRMTENYGYSRKTGEMIMVDFDELITEKSEMERFVRNQEWRRRADYLWRLRFYEARDFIRNPMERKNLKNYYRKKLEGELTSDTLNGLWKADI